VNQIVHEQGRSWTEVPLEHNGASFTEKKTRVGQLGTSDGWTSRRSFWFVINCTVYTLHLHRIGAMLFDVNLLCDPLLFSLCFHNMEASPTILFHLRLFLKSNSFSLSQAFPLDTRIFASDITGLCFVFVNQSKVYVNILQISFGLTVKRVHWVYEIFKCILGFLRRIFGNRRLTENIETVVALAGFNLLLQIFPGYLMIRRHGSETSELRSLVCTIGVTVALNPLTPNDL
jgi:hypothetical protein